jgi:hypothetical protein
VDAQFLTQQRAAVRTDAFEVFDRGLQQRH